MNRRQTAIRARTREARALELYTAGKTAREIGADLGVSHTAVLKMLRRIEARTLAEMTAQVADEKARALLKLQRIYAEAFEAWEKSKAPKTRKLSKQVTGAADATGGPGKRTAQVVTEETVGDPRFLGEARAALTQIAKILGLEAPQKMALPPPADRPLAELPDEALDELIARAAANARRH